MKKKLIIIFSSITGAALLTVAILVACSGISQGNGTQESESGTVTVPTHLSPVESDGTDSASTEGSTAETQSVTEATASESESATTVNTEEDITEETEPLAPTPSLEFSSHGNGTCSVTGIGTITDSYVSIPLRSPDGDVVTTIAERAFFGNSFIRAVEIPSTVSHIGDMAFSGCSELVYLSVDKSNKSFTDVGGMLLTADMSKIIAYPSSSGASTISIPSSVTKIAPMAFFECTNLKTIEYSGGAADWSRIAIGDMNYGLYSTSIICKGTDK